MAFAMGASYVPSHRKCECECLTAGADECWNCGADLAKAPLVFVTGFRGETLDGLLNG